MIDIYELRGEVEAYIRRYNISKYQLALKLGFKHQQSLSRRLATIDEAFANDVKRAVDDIVADRQKG